MSVPWLLTFLAYMCFMWTVFWDLRANILRTFSSSSLSDESCNESSGLIFSLDALIGWSLLESDGFWPHEALGFASGISLSMNDISFSFLIFEFQKKPFLLFFCCKQYSFFLHPLSKHLSQSIVSAVSPCCKLGYISSSEASERTALHVKVNSIVLGFLVIG